SILARLAGSERGSRTRDVVGVDALAHEPAVRRGAALIVGGEAGLKVAGLPQRQLLDALVVHGLVVLVEDHILRDHGADAGAEQAVDEALALLARLIVSADDRAVAHPLEQTDEGRRVGHAGDRGGPAAALGA